jgi:hypothetical protein
MCFYHALIPTKIKTNSCGSHNSKVQENAIFEMLSIRQNTYAFEKFFAQKTVWIRCFSITTKMIVRKQ